MSYRDELLSHVDALRRRVGALEATERAHGLSLWFVVFGTFIGGTLGTFVGRMIAAILLEGGS